MRTETYSVFVHKANVPLMKNESVQQFTTELRKAAQPWIMQKYNLSDDPKKGGVFINEVYADKAVFSVIPEWSDVSKDFFAAVKFSRSESGQFTFTDTMKVKPVTVFEPEKESVQKEKGEDESEPVEPKAELAEVEKAMDMKAWTPVRKQSLFHGIV